MFFLILEESGHLGGEVVINLDLSNNQHLKPLKATILFQDKVFL
jgi:hypothetical protein